VWNDAKQKKEDD
jgi:hypothetical protein